MFSRILLTFIIFAFSDAAPPSERGVVVSDVDGEVFFLDSMKAILNEINDLHRDVSEEGDYLRETSAVVEAMCHDFRYPVKTRLEFMDPQVTMRHDSVTRRFRRDDKKTTLTQNYGSSNDYMSSYYAQRKAIMDKYKSQQMEIMDRLTKTKSLIAERKKVKESKDKIYSGRSNVTQAQPRDPDTLHTNITDLDEHDSTTILPSSTSSSVEFTQTTSIPLFRVPILNSSIFNDIQDRNSNDSRKYFLNSSDEEADDYSSEIDSPNTTLTPIWETPIPFDTDDDEMDISDEPNFQTPESDWPSESMNFIPLQNEVDFNTTEQSLVRQELGNDTVIFKLGGHSANPSIINDSALHQLEEMFLWDVPAGDQRISRSNETGAAARQIDDDSTIEENRNIISAEDLLGHNSSQSPDSLQFVVNIKSSPEVHVTKNIKNVKTSTTTYRNSTHEIIEINGVVNSTKIIDVDSQDVKNITSTNPNVTKPSSEMSGGARESEWCEDCPHDYRWGDCEGTLFYQHNIFLRNRGPSAIDAIFGMNVQGPVYITCVEAIRYNQTRGIVTLHSGGPGDDFAKLRIRGFQGEGFSYIIKVWGVSNEDFVDSTSYSY